jgi:hypothetical protein
VPAAKETDDAPAPATAAEEKPVEFDVEKSGLPEDIKGRLRQNAKLLEQTKALAPLQEAADKLGGVPILQETVALREAFEAEDIPAFFAGLDAMSKSKSEAVRLAMVEAAAATPEWQAEIVQRATGKSLEEVKALIAGTPADKPADKSDDEYDEHGNYLTPEARRIRDLEQQLAARDETDAQKQAREKHEAETRQQAEQRAAVESSTLEFIGKTYEPVEAKARAAHLFPEDGDSPELVEIKQDIIKTLEDDLAKEFFDGKDTKAFADRTLDYLARGERETAFKRLEAAQRAAEALADKYIERGAKRIAEHIELQRLKLAQTAQPKEPAAVVSASAPGNFASAPAATNPQSTDPWAVNPDATRDALAQAGLPLRVSR